MRRMMLAAALLAVALGQSQNGAEAQYQITVNDPANCEPWRVIWNSVSAGSDIAAKRALLAQIPTECRNLRRQMETALAQAAPAASQGRVVTAPSPSAGPSVPGVSGMTPSAQATQAATATYADLQARIRTLEAGLANMTTQRDRLSRQREADLAQLNRVQAELGEMTRLGGSRVTAYCASEALSRNTAGQTSSCGRYMCENVSGLCRTRCSVTAECAQGSYCDGSVCIPRR